VTKLALDSFLRHVEHSAMMVSHQSALWLPNCHLCQLVTWNRRIITHKVAR